MAIKDLTKVQVHLFLCNGSTCKLKGAEESTAAIRAEIIEQGLSDEFHTTKTLCNGRCNDGPIVIASPQGLWFGGMVKERAEELIGCLANGDTPEEMLLYKYGDENINSREPIITG